MYIEYIRNQRKVYSESGGRLADNPGIHCPLEDSEVPEFKPTWLVRVSDMQVVPGSSVSGHYWALSYSWNQSGELIHKGGEDYDRIDEGRHQITEFRRTEEYWIPTNFLLKVKADTDFDPEAAVVLPVTFEGLIQQMCKDFGIDFIWFDQMCINQGDHDAKMQEIKQMHKIYSNARCTMALVPELQYTFKNGRLGAANIQDILKSQWCARIWTLEEAYVSKNILFLGRNLHIWSDVKYIWHASSKGCSSDVTYILEGPSKGRSSDQDNTKGVWLACTTLWYARKRTSSKAHDRIFALANIFPELMHGITFSYKQPLLDLMVQFYRDLAQKDISILLFGTPIDSDPDNKITAVRQREASLLPSWTGANGTHVPQFALDIELVITKPDYTIVGDCMRLTSSFVTVRIEDSDVMKDADGFENPDKCTKCYHNGSGMYKQYIDTPNGFVDRYTGEHVSARRLPYKCEDCIAKTGSTDMIFVTSISESDSSHISALGLKATHCLRLPTKELRTISTLSEAPFYGGLLSLTEECSRCIVLSEPAFQGLDDLKIHPVIKKNKDCYRSIGVFLLESRLNIDSLVQPKHTFCIK